MAARRVVAEPGSAVRRAPFSDNPTLGARGQLTRQRILDAALALLEAFGMRPRSAGTIDAAAHIIERGLLGRESREA